MMSWPAAFHFATRAAVFLMRSMLPTEVPPNFWTINAMLPRGERRTANSNRSTVAPARWHGRCIRPPHLVKEMHREPLHHRLVRSHRPPGGLRDHDLQQPGDGETQRLQGLGERRGAAQAAARRD